MLFEHSSFFKGEGTFGLIAFKVFVLVSMNESNVSFEFSSMVEALGAVWEFAFELFYSFVLQQVTTQV